MSSTDDDAAADKAFFQDSVVVEELSADVVKVTGYVERLSTALSGVRGQVAEVQATKSALLDKVASTFAQIQRRLADREGEIDKAVRDAIAEKLTPLEAKEATLAEKLASYQRILSLADAALSSRDASRVLVAHTALRRAAAEVATLDIAPSNPQASKVHVELNDRLIDRSLGSLLEALKVDVAKDQPQAAASSAAVTTTTTSAAAAASAASPAVVSAPAASAGSSSSTVLPTLRAPTVRGAGEGRVELSWAPVLLPPESVEAGLRVKYEVGMGPENPPQRTIYSGNDNKLAVALPQPSGYGQENATLVALYVRYFVGQQPSAWSPSVTIRTTRSAQDNTLNIEVGTAPAGAATTSTGGASSAASTPAAVTTASASTPASSTVSLAGAGATVASPAAASGAATGSGSAASVSHTLQPQGGSKHRLLRLLLWGGGGAGGGSDAGENHGGAGGFVTAVYEAEIGEKLKVTVGGGGKLSHFAPAGAPNGGGTYPSLAPGFVVAGGGGGSTHIVSGKRDNEVILGAGGGGGGGGAHLYSGTVAPGGGGGGGTADGKVGIGGQGAGPLPGQKSSPGGFGGGGGGACTLRHPASAGGAGGGAGGDIAQAGQAANGAGGGAHIRPDDGGEGGATRKAGGGGGGAASCRFCIDGTFRAVTPKGREPIVLQGEESNYSGAGGGSGMIPGRDGRAVIIMPDGQRHVFEASGEYELVVA